MLEKFINDNSMAMRLARTIVQGVFAALIVFVPTAVGYLNLGPEEASFLTAAIMAILSPLMSMLKKGKPEADEGEE